jgi:transcriptional regulator
MYPPPYFTETDMDKLHDLIDRFSFATLLTSNDGVVDATHLPLLLERGLNGKGRLLGHMARANPQWRYMDSKSVLAIFNGPDCYISPTWYQAPQVVPTWNYVTVHVRGRMFIKDDHSKLLEIVRRYVEFYESKMASPWSLDNQQSGFIDSLLASIIGFTIEIDSIQGNLKLSQNHEPERRRRVIRELQADGRTDQVLIAEMMKMTLD